jgi:hypothetical protein
MAEFNKFWPNPAAPEHDPRLHPSEIASPRRRWRELGLERLLPYGVFVLCIGTLAIIVLYGAHLASMN